MVSRIEVADRDAEAVVDLLEAVDVEHEHRRSRRAFRGGAGDRRAQPVDEQLAIGQPRQVIVDGVVQQSFFRGALLGHVEQRADAAQDLAVGAQHRPRPQVEVAVVAVLAAQAEILVDAAAPEFHGRVQRRAETVAVARMEDFQPVARRALQRSARQAEQVLCLGPGVDAVAADVPVPHDVAGAGQRQRLALGLAERPLHDQAAGEGMLHDGEPDEQHDQHQPAGERRLHHVVDQVAGDGEPRREGPHHQQHPGRDQHDGAIVAVGGEVDDDAEAGHGGEADREAGDAGRHRRLDHRYAEQDAEADQPADGEMAVAHVPSTEVEIGIGEDDQRGGEKYLRAGAPYLIAPWRDVDHPVPEAEVDAQIDQHRPGQRRGRREHGGALDHEDDGQEQRQQARDAEHDAAIERVAVDRVLVGVAVPQIKLRQVEGAQFGDEGDHRAGIEGDAEDVRLLARLAVGGESLAGRDRGNARSAEIGPQQAGPGQAEMRRHQQPVDLLVAVVGQRKHRPEGCAAAGLARLDLDAPHDAVRAGRRRHLDAVILLPVELDGLGQVEGAPVQRHRHRLQRVGGYRHGEEAQQSENEDRDTTRELQPILQHPEWTVEY